MYYNTIIIIIYINQCVHPVVQSRAKIIFKPDLCKFVLKFILLTFSI